MINGENQKMILASIKMAFKLFEAKTREKKKESQREAAHKALRESEARFWMLFSGVSDGILVADSKTRQFRYSNPAICRMLGYTEEEFLRISVDDIHPKASLKHVLAEFESLVRGETESTPDLPCLRKDNTVFYATISHSSMVLEGHDYHAGFFHDVTERKQAESQREVTLTALIESEAKYRQLVECLNEGIWKIDEKAVTTFVNPRMADMLGYTEEEMLGRHLFLFMDEQGVQLATFKLAQRQQGIKERHDFEFLRKDGTRIYASLEATPVTDTDGNYRGAIAGVVDITARKQVEAALGESEVRFRELFNRMSSGVTVYEAVDDGGDFIIRNFNPAAEKMEKVSREDVLGKRVSEVFPGTKAFGIFKVFQKVWRTGEAEYYPENICKTEGNFGRFRESWRENWVFKLPAGEIVAICNDISERKQAREDIQRQLTEKEILLREVHHRIKNNIASIGGLISLQMQSVSNAEAIAVLQDAVGRVNSMRILYDKLLLTEGYKDVSVKNYVESLIASVVALFPGSANVTIDQQIADFQLDQKRLSPLGIIINELLTNIMKHAFSNRDAGLIQITLANIDKRVTLTIQDDGIGLPPGFDINQSKGFGLMLVKMLSQQLGGSFSMEKHKGTRCTVEFNI